jgi:dihydrofolate synthase/folylpolyglutamate synthase
MISGMQANKDAAGYFAPFAGLVRQVYCVAADHEGVLAPNAVASAAISAGLKAHACASLNEAMKKACADKKNEPPRLLISGSLYLAGEVLRENC